MYGLQSKIRLEYRFVAPSGDLVLLFNPRLDHWSERFPVRWPVIELSESVNGAPSNNPNNSRRPRRDYLGLFVRLVPRGAPSWHPALQGRIPSRRARVRQLNARMPLYSVLTGLRLGVQMPLQCAQEGEQILLFLEVNDFEALIVKIMRCVVGAEGQIHGPRLVWGNLLGIADIGCSCPLDPC